jgi:glycosyltransferase involved in cell wall biosynthesis
MIDKTIIIFSYEFPSTNTGKEYIFFKNELREICKNFNKVVIVPIKKTKKKFVLNLSGKDVVYDFSLSDDMRNLKNILGSSCKTLFNIKCYLEIIKNLSLNFNIVSKIFSESVSSLIIKKWIINQKFNYKNTIFYSLWSNQVLISFNDIKSENLNFKCFARSLGSDLNGYFANSDYVPYLKKKFELLDLVIVLNSSQRQKLLRKKIIKKDRIVKSYLGVEIKKKLGWKNKKEIIFISCGNLIKIKNTLKIIDFIKYFAISNKNLYIKYILIGDGPLNKEITNEISELRENLKINFLKKIDNFPNFLREKNADFFINLSLKEGISFALMEAMSLGIPPIVSNISGNNEIVNYKRGFVLKNYTQKEFLRVSNNVLKIYGDKKNFIKKRNDCYSYTSEILNQKKLSRNFIKIIKKKLIN